MRCKKVTKYYRSQVKNVKIFIQKKHRLPKKNEEFGVWCCTQRYLYKKGCLSDEHIKLLEPLGLLSQGEYNFGIRIESINKFYTTYHRLPKRYEKYYGDPIGLWWYRIKDQVTNYTMSEWNLALFQSQYPKLFELAKSSDIAIFMNWITLLKMYQSETGKIIPDTREKYMERWIGDWVNRQRKKFRDGKLSPREIQVLQEVGVLDNNCIQ